MKHKLALATAAALLFSSLLGFLSPNDPISFIISNNIMMILSKLAIGGALYLAATRLTRGGRSLQMGLGTIGIGCIAFSLIVFGSVPLMGTLYNYLRMLDLILLAEVGIVLCLTALEMEVKPTAAPAPWRFRIASWLPTPTNQPKVGLAARFVSYFTYSRSEYR